MRPPKEVEKELRIVESEVGERNFRKYFEVYKMLVETIGINPSLKASSKHRNIENFRNLMNFVRKQKSEEEDLRAVVSTLRKYAGRFPKLEKIRLRRLIKEMSIRECFLYLHELFDEYREEMLEKDRAELEEIFRRYGC